MTGNQMTNKPDWYYDDVRQVGLDFDSHSEVATYDDRQQTSSTEDARLLDDLMTGSDRVCADIGCGTGILACEAARRFDHVHAIDVSSSMLDVARQRAAAKDLSNLSFHHAGFMNFDLPTESVDLIATKFALHHLPDLWKGVALTRIRNALKPGGRLFLRDVVFSCSPNEFADVAEDWSAWMEANTGYSREEAACHIREEYSTYAWVLEGLIRSAGLRLERATYDGRAYGDFLAVRE